MKQTWPIKPDDYENIIYGVPSKNCTKRPWFPSCLNINIFCFLVPVTSPATHTVTVARYKIPNRFHKIKSHPSLNFHVRKRWCVLYSFYIYPFVYAKCWNASAICIRYNHLSCKPNILDCRLHITCSSEIELIIQSLFKSLRLLMRICQWTKSSY